MKTIIRTFFYSSKDNKFKAPYFWSTIILLLTIICIILQISFTIDSYIDNIEAKVSLIPLIGILTGLVTFLIANYNLGVNKHGKE